MRFSCYSWWLLPPRWFGAMEELWHELVIVRGHSRWSLWGVTFLTLSPWEIAKGTLVDCSWHWVPYLCRFLRRLCVRLGSLHLLANEPPSEWSTQRELACLQACEPREKNYVSVFPLEFYWYSLIVTCRFGITLLPLSFIYLCSSRSSLVV
jgi:hypothetical protein